MPRSDLCEYSDAYFILNETIDHLTAAAYENDQAKKDVLFKNNSPFRCCISKLSVTRH